MATSILELPDGLHEGVSGAVYHQRIPGLASKGALDIVDRSPAHYKAWLEGAEKEPTPPLFFGAAFHCAALEPDIYRSTYTVEPKFGDCRRTENKARRDEWRAANAGRLLLEQADAERIAGMVASVEAHPLAGKMFRDGVPELTVKWTDPDTGLICKARGDYYVERLDVCVDLKTTEDARALAASKSVANYGYFRQDAHYSNGFDALGAPLRMFVFVFVEKSPPYAVALYSLDEDARRRGRESVRRSMTTLAECIDRGEFPSYPTHIQTLELPAWAS